MPKSADFNNIGGMFIGTGSTTRAEEKERFLSLSGYSSFTGKQNADNFGPIQMSYEFFDHETKEPVTVQGFYNFTDFDHNEVFGINKAAINNIYIVKRNPITPISAADFRYDEDEAGNIRFIRSVPQDIAPSDRLYWIMFTFDPTQRLDFMFSSLFGPPGTTMFDLTQGTTVQSTPATLVPMDYPALQKTAEPADLNTDQKSLRYTTNQFVPGQYKPNVFEPQFIFEDQINDVLNIDSVKIEDDDGVNVTSKFTVTTTDNKVTAEALPETLQSAGFYAKTYNLIVDTSLKEGADYTPYLQGTKVKIPNQSKLLVKNSDMSDRVLESNVAYGEITLQDPQPSLNKTVRNKTRTDGKTAVGDTLSYTIDAGNQTAGTTWKNVMIKDSLPEGLNAPTNIVLTKADGTTETLAASDVYDETTRELKVPAGDLTGGQNVSVTFESTVGDAALGKELVNVAEATGTLPVPEDSTESGKEINISTEASADGPIKPADPKAKITKQVTNKTRTDGKTVVGDELHYTMTASNEATGSVWNSVAISDALPEGLSAPTNIILTKVDGTTETLAAADVYDATTRTLKVPVGDLAGGKGASVSFDTTVGEDALGKQLVNVADATGRLPVPDGSTESGSEISVSTEGSADGPVNPVTPDAYLNKVVDNQSRTNGKTVVGDKLRYTMEAGNRKAGSVWKNVAINDTLPQGLSEPTNIVLTKADGTTQTLAASSVYDSSNRKLNVPVGDLAGGEHVSVSFETNVSPDALGHELVNVAEATGTLPVPDGSTESGSELNVSTEGSADGPVVPSAPNAYVKKAVTNKDRTSGQTVVDDTLHYTIEAGNHGAGSMWKNVVIKDALPEGLNAPTSIILTKADGTTQELAASAVYNATTRTLEIPVGDLAGGEHVSVSFDAKVSPDALGKELVNVANATGTTPVPDGSTESGSEVNVSTDGSAEGPVMPTVPDAYLNKAVSNNDRTDGKTVVGDTLHYTMEAGNHKAGSMWKNVVISDTLPVGLDTPTNITLTKADGTTQKLAVADVYNAETHKLEVPAGDIAGSQNVKVTFDAKVTAGALGKELINVGKATGTTPVPDGSTESGSEVTVTTDGSADGPVSPAEPDAYIDKSVHNATRANGQTVVGDTLNYTMEAGNKKAGSIWKNVVISDTLPAGLGTPTNIVLTKVDGTTQELAVADVYNAETRKLEVPVGDIAGSQNAKVTFDVTVSPDALGKELVNVAKATGTTPVPDGSTESGSEVTVTTDGPVIPTAPNAYVNKAVSNKDRTNGQTVVGDTLHYTIEAGNKKAGSMWKDVVISDTLPEGLSVPSEITITKADGTTETLATSDVYDEATRTITVPAGDLAGSDKAVVSFNTTVEPEAIGKELINVAGATGTIPTPDDSSESGSEVNITTDGSADGPVIPDAPDAYLNKEVSNQSRTDGRTVVGDTLRYTVEAGNKKAGSLWKDVVMSDALPEGLSVPDKIVLTKVDGTTEDLTAGDVYDETNRTIEVPVGDISGSENAVVSFEVQVTPDAIGKALVNVAEATGSMPMPDGSTESGSEVKVTTEGSADGLVADNSTTETPPADPGDPGDPGECYNLQRLPSTGDEDLPWVVVIGLLSVGVYLMRRRKVDKF